MVARPSDRRPTLDERTIACRHAGKESTGEVDHFAELAAVARAACETGRSCPPGFFTMAALRHGTQPLRCRAASDAPGRHPRGDATSLI